MPSSKLRKKNSRNTQNRASARTSSSRLPGDGKTFTLDFPIPRPLTLTNNRDFTLTQSFSIQSWFTNSAVVPSFTAVIVALSNFPQATTLASLFDQYRINEVEARIVPQKDASTVPGYCQLFTVLDFDDGTNLTTTAQAEEYSSCITTPGTFGHIRRYKPHCAEALYSGVFTSFGNITSPWIDAASPGVQHYGVKVASSVQTAGVSGYDLMVIANMTFRNVH